MQILRKSSFTAAPWKNGGGVTYEALRVPRGGSSFRWRVSVARIDVSGPFSDFAEYNRKMVLLQGSGVTLRFAGKASREIREIGDLVEFDGAESTYCELLNGPCVDLNLMIAKSVEASVRIERMAQELEVRPEPSASTLIFCIERGLLLETAAGEVVRLEPWDLAVLSQGAARLKGIHAGNLAVSTAVFFATISD
jgi:environmental stress-induced protein Ves